MFHAFSIIKRAWSKRAARVLLVLVLLGAGYGGWLYFQHQARVRLSLGGWDLDARVEEFERKPTAYLCFLLTDRFTSLKDHAKAIYYAERCINDFNSDSSASGWLIRLNLAFNLAELGRKKEAVAHLRKAYELDSEGRMKQGPFIENLGLSELQSEIQK